MASKDKPGSEQRKQKNPLLGDQQAHKREERREKKHALKIIRRRSHRTGHVSRPPTAG